MARNVRSQRRTMIRGLVVAALGAGCLAAVGAGFALGASLSDARSQSPLARAEVTTLTGPSGTVVLTTPTHPDVPRPPVPSLAFTTSTSSVVVGVPFTLTLTESGGAGGPGSTALISGFGPGLVVQSAGSSQGTCDSVSSQAQVTCALGTINSGGNVIVNVVVLPVTAGTYAPLGNINPIGNRSISITVNPRTSDLGVAVPGATLKPLLGHRVRAGIVIGTTGPFDDSNATLTVKIPRELRLLAATTSAGSCAGTPLVCHFAAVSTGKNDLVVLSLVAARSGTGHVAVTVTGDVADTSAANNSGSIAVSVPKRR